MIRSGLGSLGLVLGLGVFSDAALADSPGPRRGGHPTDSPAQWQRAKTLHPSILQKYCLTEGPVTYGVIVFKDRGGDIGGYQVSMSIVDSPVRYYDAAGVPLTTFHIFAEKSERDAALRLIKVLRAAFPLQEKLPCPAAASPANPPQPVPAPPGKSH